MSYENDADALIDRLIDRLVETERRAAGASFIEEMRKYEFLKVEFDDVSKTLAEVRNKVDSDKVKLNALWVAAEDVRRIASVDCDSLTKAHIEKLTLALAAAFEACGGDDIPF